MKAGKADEEVLLRTKHIWCQVSPFFQVLFTDRSWHLLFLHVDILLYTAKFRFELSHGEINR